MSDPIDSHLEDMRSEPCATFNQHGTKMSTSKPDVAVNPKERVKAKSLGAPVQTSHTAV